ncbi:MAG TPA: stage II sporulation protein D [Ruminococcaceae bacterium]|nr:stage II sporulation protein D [Oscillospiraceae bacterium]
MKVRLLTIAIFSLALLMIPLTVFAFNAKPQQSATKNSLLGENKPSAEVAATVNVQSNSVFKVYHTRTKSVEDIPADQYIRGVVAAEMPAEYPSEALKAQAAASFTYAALERNNHHMHPNANASIDGADVSDDPAHYQAYISESSARKRFGDHFTEQWEKITEAVQAVHGTALTRNGNLIEAQYFSCSAGKTESSQTIWGNDVPYLTEVASTWDSAAPDYKSTVQVSQKSFLRTACDAYTDVNLGDDPSSWIKIATRSDAGGVTKATVGNKTVSGGKIQEWFGLRSTHFDVHYEQGNFIFDVLGDGHGVGLSQFGAGALARSGRNWKEIVQYYYTGIAITPYNW